MALLVSGLSLLTVYLIMNGGWPILPGLLLLVPGLIILQRRPFTVILLWLVLMPFLLHTDTTIERRVYWVIHRGLPPMTLILILVSSALHISPRKLPRLGAAEFAMGGYLAASLFSIFLQNSTPLATAYQFYDRIIVAFCLYMIIRLSEPGVDELRWLIPVAVFISFSQFIFGILSWTMPDLLPQDWLVKAGTRTYGSMVNTSVYTTTLTFTGLLLLHAAFNLKRGLIRNLFIFTFFLTLYCIFISYSRASWMAGILVFLGLINRYPKFMLRLVLILIPVVFLALNGLILRDQLNWAQKRLYSEQSEESALSRLPVYYAALRMFETKPFFGWGYGNFDLYDRGFQARVGDLINAEKDHASHNYYLTILAEQGLVGFLLFIFPVAWWFIRVIKTYPTLATEGFISKNLLILLWLVVVSFIVVNNFANMLVVFGHGMMWITLGLIALMMQPNQLKAMNARAEPVKPLSLSARLSYRMERDWR